LIIFCSICFIAELLSLIYLFSHICFCIFVYGDDLEEVSEYYQNTIAIENQIQLFGNIITFQTDILYIA
jgi:hypothetical protein